MHRLLQRQLERTTDANGDIDYAALLELVNSAYAEADAERTRTDRAMLLTCEEMEALHEELRELAVTDPLTGLPNRLAFADAAVRALQRANAGEALAVMLVDLDRFKAINDTLGHAMGDALLREVAARLREAVCDGVFVARIGGDEFAVLQIGFEAPDAAEELARRLVCSLTAPYAIRGLELCVGACVGVAMSADSTNAVDALLGNADRALYRAKNEGRSTWRMHGLEAGDPSAAFETRVESSARIA